MPIIGVCGRKGGSGKTTTAINVACELAARGSTVVMVDCDLQGSAAAWAEAGKLPVPVHHMPVQGKDEVAGWSKTVRELRPDHIVLDSPPHLSPALGAVIGASDIAVIPCGPSGLDLIATDETVALVREIRQDRRGKRPLALLVPNRVDRRTSSGRRLSEMLAKIGEPVAPEVHYRTAFVDAFNAGEWVGAYARNSPAHREVTALVDDLLERLKMA